MTELDTEAIKERVRLRFAKMRAEREAYWASRTGEDLLRMRIEESRGDCDSLTKTLLGAAVPMWIDRMRYWRWAYRQEVARKLVDVLCSEQGVAAMCDPDARDTARKGGLRDAFNALAQGLAILSFCPGGVVFAGHHWEATTPELPEASP